MRTRRSKSHAEDSQPERAGMQLPAAQHASIETLSLARDACDHCGREARQRKLEVRIELSLRQDLKSIEAFWPFQGRYDYSLHQRYIRYVLHIRRELGPTV